MMRFLERLLGGELLTPGEVDASSIGSVLVVRQHDQLGDFLLSTPVLRAVRERFPGARIGLLVREYVSEASGLLPDVDELLVFQQDASRWNAGNGSRFLRQLRCGWDLTIVLNTVSHSLTSDLLGYFSGARYVLGSAEKPFKGTERNFFYNLVAPVCEKPRHQTDRNLDIVRYIGIDTHDRSLRIDIPEAARAAALEELRSLGLAPGVPVIGLHIGAGKLENRWPVEKFVELAGKLESVHHARIVLFWGPKEDELKGAFTQLVRVPVIGAGHPGLARLASLFACCHALVCNDTGVMHLAAAAGVPLVSLFGPTDPGEWAPLGAAMISLRAPSHRMEDIPVEEVLAALERLSLRG